MSFWSINLEKEEVEYILNILTSIRKMEADGSISIIGFSNFFKLKSMLDSFISANVRTDSLKTLILDSVIFSNELPLKFDEKDFRRVFYKIRNEIQNNNQKQYIIAFPIWNKPDFLKSKRKLDDVIVDFSPGKNGILFQNIINSRQKQQNNELYKNFFSDKILKQLEKCSLCFVYIKGNNPQEANERAADVLYQILGTINVVLDRHKRFRMSSRIDGKLPVSTVLIGPHTTSHFSDGQITHDGFWRENWTDGPASPFENEAHLDRIETRFLQLDKAISRSPWKEKCKKSMVRYYKAFSNPNLQESFLEGWRLLENINGNKEDKTQDRIRRTSNLFKNNIEYRLIGVHLAHRRNLLSHGNSIESGDEEDIVFQMLEFLVPFLEGYIFNHYKFKTEKEYWEFLDLPSGRELRNLEQARLRSRLRLLRLAEKFREERN